MYKDRRVNKSPAWTDARRPVPRLWICSAEVRGETSLGEWEHNNNNKSPASGNDLFPQSRKFDDSVSFITMCWSPGSSVAGILI